MLGANLNYFQTPRVSHEATVHHGGATAEDIQDADEGSWTCYLVGKQTGCTG